MTSRKFSRKRIGQALGLLVLSLALVMSSGGYGQHKNTAGWLINPFLTGADGWAKFQVVNETINSAGEFLAVDRLKPTNNPQEKLMRNTQLTGVLYWDVEKRAPVWLELCGEPPPGFILVVAIHNGGIQFTACVPSTVVSASPAANSGNASLQQDRVLFAGLKRFKVEVSGGVTTIRSPLTDEPAVRQNVLYFAPFIVHELKLKVGETFRLEPDAIKQLPNPLRNPVIRGFIKPKINEPVVAEAKVVQKEGEVFGAVEFTGKAVGEAIILIDYDMFSDIAQVVLSQARLIVKVKVEQ